MAFRKGQSGNPKGRKVGQQNKVTKDAKEMLELAAQGVGGLKALTDWGKANPDGFWPVWAKLLPKNVDVTTKGESLNPEQRMARLKELLGL